MSLLKWAEFAAMPSFLTLQNRIEFPELRECNSCNSLEQPEISLGNTTSNRSDLYGK